SARLRRSARYREGCSRRHDSGDHGAAAGNDGQAGGRASRRADSGHGNAGEGYRYGRDGRDEGQCRELHEITARPTMTPFLEVRDISKTFPGVRALDRVTLRVARGEVLALAGENGAGKSTLMKILTGVLTHDPGGEIRIEGEPVTLRDGNHARELGI